MRCDCVQGRRLRQTGRSGKDADLICPTCSQLWWSYQDRAIKEQPSVWPTKKEERIQTWEVKSGQWVTA